MDFQKPESPCSFTFHSYSFWLISLLSLFTRTGKKNEVEPSELCLEISSARSPNTWNTCALHIPTGDSPVNPLDFTRQESSFVQFPITFFSLSFKSWPTAPSKAIRLQLTAEAPGWVSELLWVMPPLCPNFHLPQCKLISYSGHLNLFFLSVCTVLPDILMAPSLS